MRNLENLNVIGDRVLIFPDSGEDRTPSGLYLPPTVTEKETVQSGYVVAVGPGTPIAGEGGDEDPWRRTEQSGIRYIPLEVEVGDYALYLKKHAVEIKYHEENYIIVPAGGILVVERNKQAVEINRIIGDTEE